MVRGTMEETFFDLHLILSQSRRIFASWPDPLKS
jgi:hypothetical protein